MLKKAADEKKPEESVCLYGATNGIRLEPYCIQFAELAIHETKLLEEICKFL